MRGGTGARGRNWHERRDWCEGRNWHERRTGAREELA
jgi:hypothetical protein